MRPSAEFWAGLRFVILLPLVFAAFVEVAIGYPLEPPTYLIIAAWTMLPLAAYAIIFARPRGLLSMVLVAAIIAVLRLVDWTPRKPFVEDLWRIEAGMTRAEVAAIMAPYSARMSTSADHLGFRHSDDGRYNADFGRIDFEDGRVVNVEFSPD